MSKESAIAVRDIRHEWRERAKTDLYFLCKFVLGFNDMEPEPHARICEAITSPAQHKLFVGSRGILKTTICTIGHSIQLALNNDKARILITQANEDSARCTLGMIRSLWDNCKLLRDLFPEKVPTKSQKQFGKWSDKWMQLNSPFVFPDPTYRAAGAGTNLTGTHWTNIKRDDIVSAKKDSVTGELIAPSPEDIEKAIGMHKLTLGLMVDPSTTTVDDICNRWAVYDFVRYLLDTEPYEDEENDNYRYMKLSCGYGEEKPIWPQRFSMDSLEEIKRKQGSYYFSTQYECAPMDSDRAMFKRKYLRYYTIKESENYATLPPMDELKIYAIMDQAQKIAVKACYTAVVVVGIDMDNNWWVLDVVRQRINAPDKIDLIFQLADQWNIYSPNIFGVEANLAQNILVEWLDQEQKKRGKSLNIQRLIPPNHISKDARIEALIPYFEQGRIYLRAGTKQEDLITELLDFPFGKYRDLLDCMAWLHRIAIARSAGRRAAWAPSPFSYEGIINRAKKYNQPAKTPFTRQDRTGVAVG